MANYLGYTYIDSAEVICFDENGNFLADKTDEVLSERLKDLDNAVVPGFYGAKPDGSVKPSPAADPISLVPSCKGRTR